MESFGPYLKSTLARVWPDSNDVDQDQWHKIIVAGCRYYGAINYAIARKQGPCVTKAVALSGKSYADDFLMAQFGLDRGTAHFAMNQITHHNLPSLLAPYDEMVAEYPAFADQPVAEVIRQIVAAE